MKYFVIKTKKSNIKDKLGNLLKSINSFEIK